MECSRSDWMHIVAGMIVTATAADAGAREKTKNNAQMRTGIDLEMGECHQHMTNGALIPVATQDGFDVKPAGRVSPPSGAM